MTDPIDGWRDRHGWSRLTAAQRQKVNATSIACGLTTATYTALRGDDLPGEAQAVLELATLTPHLVAGGGSTIGDVMIDDFVVEPIGWELLRTSLRRGLNASDLETALKGAIRRAQRT